MTNQEPTLVIDSNVDHDYNTKFSIPVQVIDSKQGGHGSGYSMMPVALHKMLRLPGA